MLKEIFVSFSETAYTSETVDLLFKRSAYDKTDDFSNIEFIKDMSPSSRLERYKMENMAPVSMILYWPNASNVTLCVM